MNLHKPVKYGCGNCGVIDQDGSNSGNDANCLCGADNWLEVGDIVELRGKSMGRIKGFDAHDNCVLADGSCFKPNELKCVNIPGGHYSSGD